MYSISCKCHWRAVIPVIYKYCFQSTEREKYSSRVVFCTSLFSDVPLNCNTSTVVVVVVVCHSYISIFLFHQHQCWVRWLIYRWQIRTIGVAVEIEWCYPYIGIMSHVLCSIKGKAGGPSEEYCSRVVWLHRFLPVSEILGLIFVYSKLIHAPCTHLLCRTVRYLVPS